MILVGCGKLIGPVPFSARKGLRALKKEGFLVPFIAVSLDPADRRTFEGS